MDAVNTVLLLTMVAFLKAWFDLQGKLQVGLAVLGVGLLLWFEADLASLSPLVGSLIAFVKYFLGTAGIWDFVVGAGAAIGKKLEAKG